MSSWYGLALSATLAACGARSSSSADNQAVVQVLRAHVGALERGGVPWMASVVAEFRSGTDAIREGRARTLSPEEASRRIEAADVVLVADIHTLDPIRSAFGRLVAEHGGSGPVAVVLEALPGGDETLSVRRGSAREDLLEYLRSTWPWPVEALADMLCVPAVRHAAWIGSGHPRNEVPPGFTPDRDRRPVIRLGQTTVLDAKYGVEQVPGYGLNEPTADRIDLWLRNTGAGGRVFVLYGLSHYLDGDNAGSGIRSELEERARSVLVVVPFLPEWEIAVRERGGAAATQWHEVLPGVLRGPLVSEDEIRRMRSP